MQSAPKMGVGTDLALSDYFDFYIYNDSYGLTEQLQENYDFYCKSECSSMPWKCCVHLERFQVKLHLWTKQKLEIYYHFVFK